MHREGGTFVLIGQEPFGTGFCKGQTERKTRFGALFLTESKQDAFFRSRIEIAMCGEGVFHIFTVPGGQRIEFLQQKAVYSAPLVQTEPQHVKILIRVLCELK